MNIDLISMPISIGSGKVGSNEGPKTLLQDGIVSRLFPHNVECYDIDIKSESCAVCDFSEKIRVIADECQLLRYRVVESLYGDKLPIVLGGDHSLTWGSLAGVLDVYPDACCVYVDAHGDINTPSGSPSGNVHGMHMSFLTAISDTTSIATQYRYNKINPDQLKYVATRSLDECERDIFAKYGISCITSESVNSRPIETTLAELQQWIASQERPIHLSFDIDAIDPQYAPGTGVPEHGGITPESACKIIKTIIESGRVVSLDLVEFNPRLDKEDRTLVVWRQIFATIAETLQ